MYRLATVGGFLVVALILGVVVYKTCSWPRLEYNRGRNSGIVMGCLSLNS